jgi:hypothetical protein
MAGGAGICKLSTAGSREVIIYKPSTHEAGKWVSQTNSLKQGGEYLQTVNSRSRETN